MAGKELAVAKHSGLWWPDHSRGLLGGIYAQSIIFIWLNNALYYQGEPGKPNAFQSLSYTVFKAIERFVDRSTIEISESMRGSRLSLG